MPFFKVSDMNSDGNENEMTVANNYVTAEQIAAHRWSPIEEVPALFFAKVGAAVMLNRKRLCRFPFLLDNNTMAYSLSSTEWDADFAKALFETIDLTSLVQVGALPSYNAGNVEAMEISMPSLSEQGRIGEFFKQLDNLITLHQRNSADFVSRFFSDFTNTWEQRKLGDVAKYRNGKAHENDISEQGKFIVVNSKFVSTNGEVRKFSNKQIEPLFKNEIAFVLSDVPNGRAIARTFLVDKNDKYTLNQRIAGITPIEGTCPYFLHILMNRNKYFLQFDDGAKQTNLSVDDVIEFAEYYPSSEEQQQVGVLFQQLDHLITLHQCEYIFEK